MSKTIYDSSQLYVTRLVGPAREGPDRQRWEFCVLPINRMARLTRRQVRALILVLLRDAWKVAKQTQEDA